MRKNWVGGGGFHVNERRQRDTSSMSDINPAIVCARSASDEEEAVAATVAASISRSAAKRREDAANMEEDGMEEVGVTGDGSLEGVA
jgi:hypothetical protein